MSTWHLYWVGYAIVIGALLVACIVVIAKSFADLYFHQYVGERRPDEPIGEDVVWYRGWECSYSHEAAAWTGQGWTAYLGGADLDCITVTASTWRELLDEVDDHDMTVLPCSL